LIRPVEQASGLVNRASRRLTLRFIHPKCGFLTLFGSALRYSYRGELIRGSLGLASHQEMD
jgi:hypothetical protein